MSGNQAGQECDQSNSLDEHYDVRNVGKRARLKMTGSFPDGQAPSLGKSDIFCCVG